jgi:hypothetical protein
MSRELLQQALDALEFPHDSEWSNKAKAIEALQHALAQPDKPLRLSPVYEYGHIHEASQPEQELDKFSFCGRVLDWNRAQEKPPIEISKEYWVAQELWNLFYAAQPKQEIDHPNPAAKHWHDLYTAKCQEFHDKQTILGTEIVALEEELAELKEQQPEQDYLSDAMSVLADVHADLIAEAKLAQPEQEPVAWILNADFVKGQFVEGRVRRVWWECNTGVGQPLYTAPPKREWVGLMGIEVRILKDIHIPIYSIPILDDYLNFYRAIEAKLKEKNT